MQEQKQKQEQEQEQKQGQEESRTSKKAEAAEVAPPKERGQKRGRNVDRDSNRSNDNNRDKGRHNGGKGGKGGNKKKKGKFDFADLDPKYLAGHSVGTSPDEVAAWRAARREHFPTRANVERKAKEQEERAEKATAAAAAAGGANSASGASGAKAERESAPKPPRKPKREGPSLCRKFARGQCRRGDKCTYAHDEESKAQHLVKLRKEAEKKQFMRATARPDGSDSLLRKLLRPAIIKERAVVLKCIRHMLLSKANAVSQPEENI